MTTQVSYQECLEQMYGLRRFGIKLGLDVIANMLGGLGNPQNTFRCIHVAGTNGKGSIASSLATILNKAGFCTGLYTSPHLIRFNERIRISGQEITDADVAEAYLAVKDIYNGDREPTFFEYTTAMALYEFGRRQVDWAVIETGMGGRLDATNILLPEICVISNISLEHRMYLGHTIAQITAEKGGIIKSGIPVVTGVHQKSAIRVLSDLAREKSAPIYRLGADFRVRKRSGGGFTYFGLDHIWREMSTALQGGFQVDNAAMVLAVCELLMRAGVALRPEAVRQGLAQNKWPGRLEVAGRDPIVLLDGAHNLAAAGNLSRFIATSLAGREVTMVIGILDDKPYPAILEKLLPVCKRVIITRPKIERGLNPEILATEARKWVAAPEIVPDVDQALLHAVQTTAETGVVCVAGSLYVVGEAKAALENCKDALRPV